MSFQLISIVAARLLETPRADSGGQLTQEFLNFVFGAKVFTESSTRDQDIWRATSLVLISISINGLLKKFLYRPKPNIRVTRCHLNFELPNIFTVRKGTLQQTVIN